jgi:predicted aldo/keto reductase-like oxidoreductase
MQYRTYGKTGCQVSQLGFGLMRLPTRASGKVNRKEAVGLIHRAVELGVNFFDSHFGYHGGESEESLGEALKGLKREDIFIQTKHPTYNKPESGRHRDRLDTQLERLGTDYIDFYLSHSFSWKGYQEYGQDFLEMARQAREEGIVRHIGFSFHDSPENLKKLVDTGEFECVLLQYNLLNRANEEAIGYAHEHGVGVSVMGPVGGGRLAAPSEEIRKLLPSASAGSAEVALRFVLAHPGVSAAFSGMNTLEQLEENCSTADLREPLSEQELTHVQAVLEEKKKLADLYCTGCNYCMPCEQGVVIPHIFALMNTYRLYGLKEWARKEYARLGGGHRRKWMPASECIECGQCEEKCPQKIEIMKQLKEAHKLLAGD